MVITLKSIPCVPDNVIQAAQRKKKIIKKERIKGRPVKDTIMKPTVFGCHRSDEENTVGLMNSLANVSCMGNPI